MNEEIHVARGCITRGRHSKKLMQVTDEDLVEHLILPEEDDDDEEEEDELDDEEVEEEEAEEKEDEEEMEDC